VLQRHFPALGGLFSLIDARQITIPQLLRAVFHEIGGAQQHCILVIDDYHLISAPAVHDVVQSIIELAPPNFHLVLLSRTQPLLRLHRLFLDHRIAILDEQALRFDHDEFEHFTRSFADKITDEQCDDIERQGQGWIAVLHLLLQAATTHPIARATSTSAAFMLDEFIESEIVAALPNDLLHFLIDTAPLPVITAGLAAAVTQQPLAVCEQFLRRAATASVFVTSIAPEPSSAGVRLHPLLRDRLLHRLERDAPPSHALHLRKRAAAQLAAQGDIDAALTLLPTQEIEQATAIVSAVLRPAIWRLDLESAQRWLRHLPDSIVDSHPLLARDAAWLSVLSESRDFHQRIERAAAAAPDDPDGEIAVLRALSLYFHGRHPEVRAVLDAAAHRIRSDTIADGYAHLTRSLSFDKGTPIELRTEALGAAINSFENSHFTLGAVIAVTLLGAIYALYGDVAGALAHYDHALVMLQRARLTRSSIAAEVRCARGDLSYSLGRIDAARADFTQAAADSEFMHYQAQIGLQLCDLAQGIPVPLDLDVDTHRWSAAIAARSAAPQIAWMRILRSIRLDHPEEAWKTIEYLGLQPSQLQPEDPDLLWLSVLAGTLCGKRNIEQIAVLLPQFRDRMYASRHLPIAWRAHALCIMLYLQIGRHADALAELRILLPAVEASSLCRVVEDFPALQPLLARCLDLSQRRLPFDISAREARVLALLAAGHSTEEMAAELNVGLATIRAHLRNAFTKLGVHNRAAAIHAARKANIV
jgi:LuxR family maltose regulon positive regulatory protein